MPLTETHKYMGSTNVFLYFKNDLKIDLAIFPEVFLVTCDI